MSGLFGSKPEPPKVVRMPVASDEAVRAARERARLAGAPPRRAAVDNPVGLAALGERLGGATARNEVSC